MGFGEKTLGFKLDIELPFQIFHEVQNNLMKLFFCSSLPATQIQDLEEQLLL